MGMAPGKRTDEKRAGSEAGATVAAPRCSLVWLPPGCLIPTPDNPRKVRKDGEFRSLVESVEERGVQIPLIARHFPAGVQPAAGKRLGAHECYYDLLAGARRQAAALEAKAEFVPVLLYTTMDDREAAMITVVENKERLDLTPLEDARSIELLLSKGWDAAAVAAHLGRSSGWVARRAHLLKLSDSWKSAIAAEAHWAAQWPIANLEVIARLPDETQEQVLRDLEDDHNQSGFPNKMKEIEADWGNPEGPRGRKIEGGAEIVTDRAIPKAETLSRWIAEEYLHTLAGAPWMLDDASLVVEAGNCTNCIKRSGAQPLLFDDMSEPEDHSGRSKKKQAADDRCLDRKCYEAKRAAFVTLRVRETREQHGVAYAMATTYGEKVDKTVRRAASGVVPAYGGLGESSPVKKKEGDRGAVPAVVTSGPDIGKVEWIAKPAEKGKGKGGSAAGPAKESLPAQRERARRGLLILEITRAIDLKNRKGGIQFSADLIVRLLAAWEGNEVGGRHTDGEWVGDLQRALTDGGTPSPKELKLASAAVVGLLTELPSHYAPAEHDEHGARVLAEEFLGQATVDAIVRKAEKKYPPLAGSESKLAEAVKPPKGTQPAAKGTKKAAAKKPAKGKKKAAAAADVGDDDAEDD